MMKHLTYRKITIFWIPLAATWLMMAVEGPFLAAVIARLDEAKFNLAAYGVAFSFALIIEAPIIMMMSASTALVKDRQSYLKLRNFTNALNALITAVMLFFLIPPVFDFIARDVIGLPENVSELTYFSTMILLPWPGAIGFRRFYQGIMIRYNVTRRVAYGTIIRLFAMSVTALLLYRYTSLSGAYVGAAALSAGVTFEALMSRIMVNRVIKTILKQTNHQEKDKLSYRAINRFYYPLALTSFLGLAIQPLITFFLGQSRMALNSLAVLPVINSLIFIFRSMGLSYQEVGIALLGNKGEGLRELRNFALFLSGAVSLILGTIAFTGLSELWFGTVSGLPHELVEFAKTPTQLLVIMPALSVLIAFERALMVAAKRTKPVTVATGLEVLGVIIVLIITIYYLSIVGAIAAALAMVLGRLIANLYLYSNVKRAMRHLKESGEPM